MIAFHPLSVFESLLLCWSFYVFFRGLRFTLVLVYNNCTCKHELHPCFSLTTCSWRMQAISPPACPCARCGQEWAPVLGVYQGATWQLPGHKLSLCPSSCSYRDHKLEQVIESLYTILTDIFTISFLHPVPVPCEWVLWVQHVCCHLWNILWLLPVHC